jgi:hypothetical protein
MIPEEDAITLTRQQLYEKVWTTPATILAKEFGISDVALGKTCRRHVIPKPPPGYWAAKRFGKSSPPPSLPDIDDQELEIVTFEKRTPQQMLPESENIRAMSVAEKSSKLITVPNRTGLLHPLVARTKAAIAESSANYKGIVSPQKKDCLGISVGVKSIGRAIRILNALIRALESKGYPVSAGRDYRRAVTIVKIQQEQVMFRLEEAQIRKKRVKKPGDTYFYEGYDYVPSGKLILNITSLSWTGLRQRWRYTGKNRIENQLNSFIAGLIAATEKIKIERLERERRDQEWEEERQRRAEAERLRIEKEERIKELDRVVSAWQKSQIIRFFCDSAVQRISGDSEGIKPENELGKWLTWARQYADELDPIRSNHIVLPSK